MLEDHKNEKRNTALVICNSFDENRFDIEEYLHEKEFYTEMFEIDRMRK